MGKVEITGVAFSAPSNADEITLTKVGDVISLHPDISYLKHIKTKTSTGSITNVEMTSLTLATGTKYLLRFNVQQGSSGNQTLRFFVNADTTVTNYDSSIAGNTSDFLAVLQDGQYAGEIFFEIDPDGYFVMRCFSSGGALASCAVAMSGVKRTSGTVASITALRISGVASNISDTEMKLYEIV